MKISPTDSLFYTRCAYLLEKKRRIRLLLRNKESFTKVYMKFNDTLKNRRLKAQVLYSLILSIEKSIAIFLFELIPKFLRNLWLSSTSIQSALIPPLFGIQSTHKETLSIIQTLWWEFSKITLSFALNPSVTLKRDRESFKKLLKLIKTISQELWSTLAMQRCLTCAVTW